MGGASARSTICHGPGSPLGKRDMHRRSMAGLHGRIWQCRQMASPRGCLAPRLLSWMCMRLACTEITSRRRPRAGRSYTPGPRLAVRRVSTSNINADLNRGVRTKGTTLGHVSGCPLSGMVRTATGAIAAEIRLIRRISRVEVPACRTEGAGLQVAPLSTGRSC
jgi:hypothetical protein